MKKPARPELSYLRDIRNAAELAVSFVAGMSREDFDKDLVKQGAVMHHISIIGEATKHISQEFRSVHPEIKWKDMAVGTFRGYRDSLVSA